VVLDRELRLFVDERPVAAEALERQLTELARSDPDTEVLLRVDAAVPYGRVAALIGQVQAAGLSRIGFVAEPPAAGR
jgi:biopolymer transport protein TolR